MADESYSCESDSTARAEWPLNVPEATPIRWQHHDLAVLIDFDTRHELTINAAHRHSDDLKVVLLELLAMPE